MFDAPVYPIKRLNKQAVVRRAMRDLREGRLEDEAGNAVKDRATAIAMLRGEHKAHKRAPRKKAAAAPVKPAAKRKRAAD